MKPMCARIQSNKVVLPCGVERLPVVVATLTFDLCNVGQQFLEFGNGLLLNRSDGQIVVNMRHRHDRSSIQLRHVAYRVVVNLDLAVVLVDRLIMIRPAMTKNLLQ